MKGHYAERLAFEIEALVRGTRVRIEAPAHLRGRLSGSLREVDAAVYSKDSDDLAAILEVRDHRRPQGPTWIEQLAVKQRDAGARSVVAISTSGFTSGARQLAARERVELRILRQVDPHAAAKRAYWEMPHTQGVLRESLTLCKLWTDDVSEGLTQYHLGDVVDPANGEALSDDEWDALIPTAVRAEASRTGSARASLRFPLENGRSLEVCTEHGRRAVVAAEIEYRSSSVEAEVLLDSAYEYAEPDGVSYTYFFARVAGNHRVRFLVQTGGSRVDTPSEMQTFDVGSRPRQFDPENTVPHGEIHVFYDTATIDETYAALTEAIAARDVVRAAEKAAQLAWLLAAPDLVPVDLEAARGFGQFAIDSEIPHAASKAALALAIGAMRTDDLEAARAACEIVLRYPNEDGYLFAAGRMGVFERLRGNEERALELLQEAARASDEDVAGHACHWLGRLLEEHGEFERARDAYEEAVNLPTPEAAPAAIDLGIMLSRRGDAKAALAAFEKARGSSVAEHAAEASYRIGIALRDDDQTAARAALEEAVALSDADWSPRAALALGGVLTACGEADLAVAAYENAIALDHPEASPKALMQLAAQKRLQGDVRSAEDALRRAGPADNGRARLELGELLRDQRRLPEATEAFLDAIRLGDDDVVARAQVGLADVLSRRWPAARVLYAALRRAHNIARFLRAERMFQAALQRIAARSLATLRDEGGAPPGN